MSQIIKKVEKTTQEITPQSWIAIISETDKETEIYYYNKTNKKNEEFEQFISFVEYCIDELYPSNKFEKSSKKINEDFAYIESYSNNVIDSYDEYSNKQIQIPISEGIVMSFYKEGIGDNLIPLKKIIQKNEKMLSDIEKQGILEAEETKSFLKCPHKYYGVNKKDFF